MLKAVLNTNVVVSGTIVNYGPPCAILQAWREGQFTAITSETLLAEIREKLEEPRIKRTYKLTDREISLIIIALRKYSHLVKGKLTLKVIKEDPDDDQVIIAAVEGKANYIVSCDRHLLELETYKSIKIVPPAEFVKVLGLQ